MLANKDAPSDALLGQLVRIPTSDGLELQGLLYEPAQSSTSVVVHIPGWTGNFYENVFLDYIARACLAHGYSFLSFNTRGAGFVQEFLKKQNGQVEYVKIGGSLERFEDCLIDIGAALDFLQTQGYNSYILEGHSTGCQKVGYYSSVIQDPKIKGLVLLEASDDPSIVKKILGDRYQEAMDYAKEVVRGGTSLPMPDWIPFGVQLSAQKFLSIADPNSVEGNILHVPGNFEVMRAIHSPLLVISSEYSEYQDPDVMQSKLVQSNRNTTMHIVQNSGHWFFGHEEEIGDLISKWLSTA